MDAHTVQKTMYEQYKHYQKQKVELKRYQNITDQTSREFITIDATTLVDIMKVIYLTCRGFRSLHFAPSKVYLSSLAQSISLSHGLFLPQEASCLAI